MALVLSESGPSTAIVTEVATPARPNDYTEPPATSTEPPNAEPSGAITSAQNRPPRPKGWIRVLANDTCENFSYVYIYGTIAIQCIPLMISLSLRYQDKRPSKGFMSYQRGEVLYASAWQEMNSYGRRTRNSNLPRPRMSSHEIFKGVAQRMATDMTLQRHGSKLQSPGLRDYSNSHCFLLQLEIVMSEYIFERQSTRHAIVLTSIVFFFRRFLHGPQGLIHLFPIVLLSMHLFWV